MNLVRHLRIGDMLNKTTIKERLASDGLSFTEFSYQTFQAYDWLHLFRKYNCLIQVCCFCDLEHLINNLVPRLEEWIK